MLKNEIIKRWMKLGTIIKLTMYEKKESIVEL